MSARKARTEAAAAGAAPVDSEEKDVKIPVEAVDDTEVNEAPAAEAAENQVEDSNKEATMTEDEMVEAAIRAGEEAADNDFKLKFEQAQKVAIVLHPRLPSEEIVSLVIIPFWKNFVNINSEKTAIFFTESRRSRPGSPAPDPDPPAAGHRA